MNRQLLLVVLLLLGHLIGWAQWPSYEDVTLQKGVEDVEAISYIYGNGAAIADFDMDGDLDFFLCTDAGIPHRLYINEDGMFEENAALYGLNSEQGSKVALWMDYDGDMDLDLVTLNDCYTQGCNTPITISLYQQQSNGLFLEVGRSIGLDFEDKYLTDVAIACGGLAAGDLNNDGYLDLIVSVWGGPITYFENTTTGEFEDRSQMSQIGPDFQFRWQPMIYDFDGDGYQDIYVNVDFEENELWMNNGDGTFTDEAAATLSDSAFNEMGLTLGDYDNDGDMDIYATNISRVDNGVLRHNILLRNFRSSIGTVLFEEVANDLQVGASGWDWGTTFFDANNDGQLDLVSTNGWTPSGWDLDQSRLWLNLGDGLFGDISTSSLFNDTYDATSLLAFDMDRDGDLDLLQTLKENVNTNAPLVLYENNLSETSDPGNYVVIKPRGNETNYLAIGAIVKLTINNITQTRLISAGTSLYGQEPAEAYFGIGEHELIDEIRVIWPDQTETIEKDLGANQVYVVNKDQSLSIETPEMAPLRYYPNPVLDQLNLSFEKTNGHAQVFNVFGQPVIKVQLHYGDNKLDFSELQAGLYFIRITDSAGLNQAVIKILKN